MKFETTNSVYEMRRREGRINVICRSKKNDKAAIVTPGYSVTANPEDIYVQDGMLFANMGMDPFLRTSFINDEDLPRVEEFLRK